MRTKAVKIKSGTAIFKLARNGLFHTHPGQKRQRICGKIRIRGLASYEGSSDLFVVLRVSDASGNSVDLVIRRSEFRRRELVMQLLSDNWLDSPRSKESEDLLYEYLNSFKPKLRHVLLLRTGWIGNSYVFPDMIAGIAKPKPIYRPAVGHGGNHPLVGGSLEKWTNTVATLAKYSDRITLAISVSFYALIMAAFGNETSATFHVHGPAGHGKTTLLTAAQSIHGWAGRDSLFHWDLTRTGLNELAAEHCDRLLVLDELARLGDTEKEIAAKAQAASFNIASGHGRVRSAHFGKNGNPTRWRVVVLSTGEIGISENAAVAGKARLDGDLVRLIDIPAIATAEHGVFNRIPKGYRDSEAAILALEKASAENFGHPARAFILRFLEDRGKYTALLTKWEQRFFEKANVPQDKWERRFARRFARVYAAGMLARRFKIVPWSAKWTRQAITNCYHAARQAVPNYELMLQEALEKVTDQLRNKSVLHDLRKGKPAAKALAEAEGYIKADPTVGLFCAVRPKSLQEWIGPKLDVREFAKHLDRQGLLVKTKHKSLTKPVLISGIAGKPRYYCLRLSNVK